MYRQPGLSVRLKLTLSYTAFLLIAGVLLLAAVWLFLLRGSSFSWFVPNLADIARALSPSNFGPRVFLPAALLVMAFMLVFGLVGGWFLSGRMLAPLNRITYATRAVGNGAFSHRIRMPGRSDEFRELADAFDAMLERLEAHVAEQRRFAANASHELRTPLATMQAILDVARTDPDRDIGDLVERLHTVNTRAIDLTEALLLLSRADQRSFAREHVDLSLLVDEAAETLVPLAETHRVAIRTSGDVTPAVGSPALLLQLTTNLVHNAIVHNLPDRGTVWVGTGARPGHVALIVENTGDELAPELVATLTEPFRRATDRVRTGHAGVGLGLAIASSITRAHDGTLTLAPRPGGGLRVTVELPTPSGDPGRHPAPRRGADRGTAP